ncbi:uncharacterized protein LOC129742974 [Uranotaenia lowii]|uniref:uncharacterized protein LOC129742974 n=1 Tax=Uranotaenia lowii TaxID=190385 RepID=UPI00247A516E|nr:uncharacterized protein LOC129742974 [Uranotaenia lowii]
MIQFAKDWDFEHVTSSPHHQQANGKAEAAVKIAKRLIRKADETGSDYWFALLHWRNIPNKIGSSPAARLFSRSTRCSVPTAAANLLPKVVENVPESIEQNRKCYKKQYDKRSRNLPGLQSGSPVYVQLNPEASKQWTPGTVSSQLNERSYLVNEPETSPCRSAPANTIPEEKEQKTPFPSLAPINFPISCPSPNNNNNNNNNLQHESPPTTIIDHHHRESSSVSPIPSSSIINSPIRVSVTSRPKREHRIPSKLKDYELEY